MYWFGLPKNAESLLPNVQLIDGRKINVQDKMLKKDIQSMLDGEVQHLVAKLYGFS